ncbi:HAD family phosphatase [Bacillus sp. FJAT-49732]|uniref:HAD family phosphatase n=1 Tax=Lederbergia citrisecunda TaxID=2833583 RepID=A0A942YIN9_9BACI|nr:Cof-type HAD-IIB family hydrolase [Lederbergia citrisecunda]MBS4198513.1 HAD family phosphatase [Lederbergia citrisecunda]
MVYKMLVLNIDGTLLQDNGRINKMTREAIEFAQSKDIKVVLATSKNFSAAKRVAKSLKVDSHIVSHQGGFIAKELNKPVYVNKIHEKLTSEITTFLESFSCQIKLVHEKFSIGNKVKLPDNILAKVVFQRANRFTYSEQYVDQLSEKLIENPVSPPKIEAIFDNTAHVADAIKAMEEMYDEVVCIKTDEKKLDIVATGVSKLNGVKYLCEQYGVNRQEVVAIGAGFDDLPLIKWAGLGVAMGNAPDIVRSAANWNTRTNNDNGVAYMVKEHFRKQYKLEFLKKINVLK